MLGTKHNQAQVAAAPVLIRRGGHLRGCGGAPSIMCPWPSLVVGGPITVDMRLTGDVAVAGATAANFDGGYGLPGRDILG